MGSCSTADRVQNRTANIRVHKSAVDRKRSQVPRQRPTKEASSQAVYQVHNDSSPLVDAKLNSPDTHTHSVAGVLPENVFGNAGVGPGIDVKFSQLDNRKEEKPKNSQYFLQQNFVKRKKIPALSADEISKLRDISSSKKIKEQVISNVIYKEDSAQEKDLQPFYNLQTVTIIKTSSRRQSTSSIRKTYGLSKHNSGNYLNNSATNTLMEASTPTSALHPNIEARSAAIASSKRTSSMSNFDRQYSRGKDSKQSIAKLRFNIFSNVRKVQKTREFKEGIQDINHNIPETFPTKQLVIKKGIEERLKSTDLMIPKSNNNLSPRKTVSPRMVSQEVSPETSEKGLAKVGPKLHNDCFSVVIKKSKIDKRQTDSEIEQFKRGSHPVLGKTRDKPKAVLFINDKFISAKF